ncbi:MAG TPA: hypothetical protein VN864_04870 [Thermoplasmata archaeon]|nr:hypothetical protein [Thermoplasmata archaeon]
MRGRTKALVLTIAVVGIFVLGLTMGGGALRSTTASALSKGLTALEVPPIPLLPGHATGLPYASEDPHALSWSAGQPYPQVGGRSLPPPGAPPYPAPSAPATIGGHWYAGSVYSGTATNSTWVLAEISVPSAGTPDASEFYYNILSIWDNAGSYDQIGFTDDYGTWGLAYSYTSGNCSSPTYHYSTNYLTMTPGQEYLLAITTSGSTGGTTGTWLEEYSVASNGSVSGIFALHAPTGATDPGLQQAAFYCGFYDYTDYEEVYGGTSYSQPDPYLAPEGMTWYFHLNCYGASGCITWTTWSAWKTTNTPPGTVATIGKYKTVPELVTIENLKINKGWTSG